MYGRAEVGSVARSYTEVWVSDGSTLLILAGASQTNFYAVRGNTLYTAGDGILMGTVRRLVLEVCKEKCAPCFAPNFEQTRVC